MERQNYHARSCWASRKRALLTVTQAKTDSYMQIQLQQVFLAVVHLIQDSFFSDEIEMRDRTFARTCFSRGQIDSRFMAEEGDHS